MTAETAQPLIEPDAAQMRQHVEHLFGGWLDGCHHGKIELAWCDGRDGKLKHAAIYDSDQLDELVERAVQVNRIPGQNVYIGQALRKPDIPPFGRCTDADFLALSANYVDIDDDVLKAARERYRGAGCPPTAVVVTGRQPHTRVQMLWRLEIPERDADLCRRQNLALATALGGDTTVVNPSRVLRLGGSIAWPAKPGRVLERTEFHLFNDGRPKVYVDGQLARAFPPKPAASARPTELAARGIETSAAPKPDLKIGSEFDGVSVEACLARIRAGDHWHDNLVRLTGHWIGRGWSDEEILTAAEGLTLAGYTTDQTRRELAQMIEGGRVKWNIANPTHEVGDDEPDARPPVIDPREWAGKPLPERQWLVEDWIPMHHVTALYGDGGLGKTLLAHQLLTAVATGGEWLGMAVKRCKAFGLLCEDHAEDLHISQERINAALWLAYDHLGDLRLWSSVGFDNLLMTFDGRDGARGRLTAFFSNLLHEVKTFGARFVVLDTASDLFGGNENIRMQVRQFVANACGRLAREIDGTVLLCAHPSLSGMTSGTGAGGSTAWNNTVRSRLYLTRPKADGDDEIDPDLRVLTRKKANYARAGTSITLRWTDGLLVPVERSSGDDEQLATLVLNEIERAWNDGQPYSDVPQSRSRYILTRLPQRISRSKADVERTYLALLDGGRLRVECRSSKRHMRGLRVVWRTEELAKNEP